MAKSNTDQMEQKRNSKGQIIGGPPPAGFNKHPENRNPGGWRKSDTPRYKLEQMMKLGEEETSQQSFIQMVADYVVHLFTNIICQRKNVAVVNTFEKERYECFAIKQEFEYQFIG